MRPLKKWIHQYTNIKGTAITFFDNKHQERAHISTNKSGLEMRALRDFYAVHEGNHGGSSGVHRVANLLLMMKLKAKSCGG